MKLLTVFGSMAIWLLSLLAAESSPTNESDAAQWQKIYERFRIEKGITNAEELMKKWPLVRDAIVHPSFGIYWYEVPAPTITNSSAMSSVNAFIVTNGWNMATNDDIFGELFPSATPMKPIRGLPWPALKDREFMAVTHNGVFYVKFTGWHHNYSGVAYNPNTNSFAAGIRGFKPIGNHWYAWAQPEDPADGWPQIYEGQNDGEQGNPTNGSQKTRSETNRAPTAVSPGTTK